MLRPRIAVGDTGFFAEISFKFQTTVARIFKCQRGGKTRYSLLFQRGTWDLDQAGSMSVDEGVIDFVEAVAVRDWFLKAFPNGMGSKPH